MGEQCSFSIMAIDYHQITIPQRQNILVMATMGILATILLSALHTRSATFSPRELLSPGNLQLFVLSMLMLAAFLSMFLWLVLRNPNVIILSAFDRTITLKYLIPALAPANRNSLFSDWEAVLSCLYSGKYGTSAVLLLRSADGKYLSLTTQAARTNPPKGFWDVFSVECSEPEEMRDLRIRIANLTGLKDGGFLHEQIYNLSLKKFP